MQPTSQRETPVDAREPRHAGVWVRVAAALVDVIIMGVPVLLLVNLVAGVEPEAAEGAISLADLYDLESFLNVAVLTAITILLWVNWDGRTPGKKLLSLRIVSYPEYRRFSYGTATVRFLLSLTGAVTFGLGYLAMAIMIAARDDKRGYHDLVAGTCVIHDK